MPENEQVGAAAFTTLRGPARMVAWHLLRLRDRGVLQSEADLKAVDALLTSLSKGAGHGPHEASLPRCPHCGSVVVKGA